MTDYQFNPKLEQWKEIFGCYGYEVSDHGRVKSLVNGVTLILKPVIKKIGYTQHNLKINGKYKSCKVHNLVLSAFVGNCPKGCQCRHLDGNKSNNILSNLRWGTAAENAHDRKLHGTENYAHGDAHYRAIFNSSHILAIRYLFSIGFNNMTLANLYHTSRSHISVITNRKSWKHI